MKTLTAFFTLIAATHALPKYSDGSHDANPAYSHNEAATFLGSSFGIPGRNRTFDYLVVGGGTAGLTIATRLIEQQAGSVAVIEAGSFYELTNGNLSQLPANDYLFTGKDATDFHPGIDWGYISEPQKGADNATMHYARGKVLGGSSARHYMAYQRPTRGALKQWADAVGDQSYNFDKFLPYYEKNIKFTDPNMSLRPTNASVRFDTASVAQSRNKQNIALNVGFPNYVHAFTTWAAEGLKAIGLNGVNSFISGSLLGQAYVMTTISPNGLRESSETAFLQPMLGNDAYTVYQQTLAKKIIFDGQKKASGVLIETLGLQYTLNAKKEVIVSSGFVGSPQLLQVSGIGPAELLNAHNIPVIADRPGVGQQMEDHVIFAITYQVNAPTISSLQDPAFAAKQSALLNEKGSGMYSNPITEILAWEKVPQPYRSAMSNDTQGVLSRYPADWPEIEYITSAAYVGTQQNTMSTGAPFDGKNYASLAVVLNSPRSRGTVNITSADSAVHPALDPNFLVNPADVDVTLAGFKRARDFWNTTAMAQFKIGDEVYPGAATQSDDEIKAIIRKSYNTIFHGSTTCKMGKVSDPLAVVDSKAKVIGVQNLRVVDASAFPFLPPGHPQSTVYALAEKIACDISGKC
ncbi:hypothetical protein G7054_g257 [Neopestalotiopsis clavispora]|nr:hypothetical protein G7054_g257 [Neopestalotiopsis clavispora]